MKRLVMVVGLMTGLAIVDAGYAQNPQSKIQVFTLKSGMNVIVVQSMTSKSVEAARLELMPEAKRICGTQPVWFGEYQFDGGGNDGPFLLMQPIGCVDLVSPPSTVVRDPAWRPTEMQHGIILELTRRYFRLKDADNFEQVRQFLAPSLPFGDWRASSEKFNKQAGEVRYRKVEKVTWYKDPPNAFAPGLFTAVDFTGQFANIDIYCGFVVWHRGEDNMTRLLREEQNYISREMQQKMSSDELTAMRKKLGC
jgi:hypothetical protein